MPHSLQVYQNPIKGTGFVAQYDATGVRWTKKSQGGDDFASCSVRANQAEAYRMYSEMVGSLGQFYTDNPSEPNWEGIISRVTIRIGGIVLSRSLDTMGNAVIVQFYDINNAGAKTRQTTEINNTLSQGQFGKKEKTVEAGLHYNTLNVTHKNDLADLILVLDAFPGVSVTPNSSASGTTVEIELVGLQYYVWDWITYVNATVSTVTASEAFRTVATDSAVMGTMNPNMGATIATTTAAGQSNGYLINTNSAFSIPITSTAGQTALQYLRSVVEAGTGATQYVFGITRRNIWQPTRYVYYRPARTAVAYGVRARQDVGRVRDRWNNVIPPQYVEPDNVIQILDLPGEWTGLSGGDDPRLSYISGIEYDGDARSVTWTGGDNPTLEGALLETGAFKFYRKSYGAPAKQAF